VIDQVSSHISQSPCSPIDPASPVKRMIEWMVFHLGSRPEKKIPFESLGDWVAFSDGLSKCGIQMILAPTTPATWLGSRTRTWNSLRPDRPVGPDVNLTYRANYSCLYPLVDTASTIRRVSLISHLCYDTLPAGSFSQNSGLMYRVSQRLLDVDVLAQLHRRLSHNSMCVIGSCH